MHSQTQVVAIIPVRGGSKGVPGKNLRRVAGRSLTARAVDAARAAGEIDRVVVSTDSAEITLEARSAGAEVVIRPDDISGDTASSEAALLHALGALTPAADILVFIQATSPFIDPRDLDAAIRRVRDGDEDVVFAATETFAFLWEQTPDGAVGVNHDKTVRPRRQDRDAQFQETGAFYVMRAGGFIEAGHRFFGRVGIAEVDYARSLEIDTARELEIAGLIASLCEPTLAVDVDALVMDFDGVHTDDLVTIDASGVESVTASRSDGMGIEFLRNAGVPMLILSREKNPVVTARGAKLRVEVRQGVDDKAAVLAEWAGANSLDLARVAYVGNDVNDLATMGIVGWPIAVADSNRGVAAASRLVLTHTGGHGAIRELAELILSSRTENRQQQEEPWQSVLAE
jgi:YrbI family 3-deoxy-D-manno-octulosonate 8-phosphate phosphatase